MGSRKQPTRNGILKKLPEKLFKRRKHRQHWNLFSSIIRFTYSMLISALLYHSVTRAEPVPLFPGPHLVPASPMLWKPQKQTFSYQRNHSNCRMRSCFYIDKIHHRASDKDHDKYGMDFIPCWRSGSDNSVSNVPFSL